MRHRYLDWLRVISALSVVAIHVLSHYLGGFPFKETMWTATMAVNHLFFFCIPVFFMISGALLIKPLDKMTYREYLQKRFMRICIPFITWSVIHWLVVCVAIQGKTLSVAEFFKLFFSNAICRQYWYVYATIVLYPFLPFLGCLVNSINRKQLQILVCCMLIVNLGLPYVDEILKAFSTWKITNYNMSSMGAYMTYAIIGYTLHTMDLPSKRKRHMIYAGGAGAWMLMNVLCWLSSTNQYARTLVETKYPLVCMVAIAVFIAVKAICQKHPGSEKNRIVGILSAESYTAYLTHMLCLRVLQVPWETKYVVSLGPVKSLGIMLAEWIIGTIGCFGIAFLAHKLPKRIAHLF